MTNYLSALSILLFVLSSTFSQAQTLPDLIFKTGFEDECHGIGPLPNTFLDNSRRFLPQLFGTNAQWGVGASTTQFQYFDVGQYVVLEFVPPVPTGTVSWTIGSGNTGMFRVRVSKCRADFRSQQQTSDPDIEWCALSTAPSVSGTIRTTVPPAWGCRITTGERYYLNILLESCPVSTCQFYGTLREL